MPKLRTTLPKEFNAFCSEHMPDWSAESIEECRKMLTPCDPNARDRGGYKETALHKFIPLEIVQWLVERGADVNMANTYGTPLFKHARVGHYDICKFLIEHGADVNLTAHAEHTALFPAAQSGNCDTVRLLLAHGADPCHHSVNWDGHITPLLYMLSAGSYAWREENPDIAEVLVNAQKERGGIPEEEWTKAQEYVSKMGHEFEFRKNDMEDEYRKQIENIMNRFYAVFDVAPAKPVLKHDGKSLIEVDETLSVMEQHSALWEFLVPSRGKCATAQGEVIRISARVDDEANRNGGVNWDAEYQKMLEMLTQYFSRENALNASEMDVARKAIAEIGRSKASPGCQKQIDRLMELAVKWIRQNPEPVLLEEIPYNR
ncbi:MAG: ankyrin repeat domain-containing protein [Acetatifactor sp.]|nr:ankyrin repeat domain-containing protein [Acetatifactor sp.]